MTFFYDLNKRLAALNTTALNESKHTAKKTVDEADMEEGNEFSGELTKARAAGKKEFEVDGKTYPVKEGAKPDYIDLDKDGNRKETMKKAAADKKAAEHDLDEQWITEKWPGDVELDPAKKGMFKGKTKADLEKQLSKLKASGPHEKGSAAYTKMKQLQFAIRAKKGWKGGVDESEGNDEDVMDYLNKELKDYDASVQEDGIGDVMTPKDKAEKMRRAKGGRDYYEEGQEQPHDIPLKGKSSPGTDFASVKADKAAKLTTKKGIVPEADVTGLGDSKGCEMEDAVPYQPNKNTPAPDYERAVLEGVTRQHFKQVAELLRAIENDEKRAELAQHHADIFAQQNPRFDRNKFFAAVGVDKDLAEGFADMDAWLKQREAEKGTGKFDKRKVSTGTVYTRKPETFDPDAEEKDLEGNVVKRGRGRPKKVAEHGSGVENVPGKSWQSSKAGAHPWNAESKEMDEDYDRDEYDEEGEMAKSQSRSIADAAKELQMMLGDDENLPEWVQKKITLAQDYIDSARDYLKANRPEQEIMAEKAVSRAQQKAMGAALAAKRGDIPKSELKGASKEMVKMSAKDLEDFAATKHKGLPEKVAKKKVKEEDATVGDQTSQSKPGAVSKDMQFGKGIYEEFNSRVETLITEGMNISVNMSADSVGNPNKNITVSADGDDADKLAEILKMAGIMGGDKPCDACGATPCGCDAVELEEADVTVDENNPDWPTNQETSDDPFQYSGGLNKPKSTGQTTVDRGIPSLDPRRQVTAEGADTGRSLLDLYKAIENK